MTVLVGGGAAAQGITITEQDIRDQMVWGKSVTNANDSLTKSIDIGTPGASSRDFSGLLTSAPPTLVRVDPATTPYIGSFPGATFSLQTTMTVYGISGTAYIYLTLDTNLMNPGLMAGASTFLGPVTYTRGHAPSDVTYSLPSSYGTTWTSVYTSTDVISLAGSIVSSTSNNHHASYLVDGYGTMTLPGGAMEEVLRIRKEDSTSTWRSLTFIFLSKTGASVQVDAADPFGPDSGVIQCTLVRWNGPAPTGVEATEAVPAEFVLRQNFPNPFNPSTTIRFAVPERAHVRVQVFNVMGEAVATLHDGAMEAGEKEVRFDATGLSSGVYLCRMTAGEFVQTRSLMLLK
jgi:hypothetical protein